MEHGREPSSLGASEQSNNSTEASVKKDREEDKEE